MHKAVSLAALVALDLGTKFLALAVLSDETRVRPGAAFQFVLNLNKAGLGTWIATAATKAQATQLALAGFSAATLGLYLLAERHLARRGWSVWRRVLMGVGAFLIGRIVGALAVVSIGGVSLIVGVILTRLGGAALFMALWWRAREGMLQVSMTLFAAGALGNLLSLVLPPHAVVDFMYSAIIKALFRQEILNLADLYYDAAVLCLVAWFVRYLVNRLRATVTPRSSGA
jgi:hypothetical protein